MSNADDKFDFDPRKQHLLKSDLFGTVSKEYSEKHGWLTFRNTAPAPWWTRTIARYLARREAQALKKLPVHPELPTLLHWDGTHLLRAWIDGEPMQIAKPSHPDYYRHALQLLRFLHRHNLAHNDLSKETNWLVTPSGKPALVDFQLARHFKNRTRWFRNSAREDIRYLLKHKRGFCPEAMTQRQWRIVNTPALPSRIWRKTGKPLYLFITRRIFKWQDREGAYDRHGEQLPEAVVEKQNSKETNKNST